MNLIKTKNNINNKKEYSQKQTKTTNVPQFFCSGVAKSFASTLYIGEYIHKRLCVCFGFYLFWFFSTLHFGFLEHHKKLYRTFRSG